MESVKMFGASSQQVSSTKLFYQLLPDILEVWKLYLTLLLLTAINLLMIYSVFAFKFYHRNWQTG